MEIVSKPVTLADFEDEVEAFSEYLRSRNLQEAIVEYGWGCALKQDELWNPKHVSASELGAFIRQSSATGLCRIGTADMFIKAPDGEVVLKLCHEGDIHLFIENERTALAVIQRWLSKGMRGYVRAAEQHRWLPLEDFLSALEQ